MRRIFGFVLAALALAACAETPMGPPPPPPPPRYAPPPPPPPRDIFPASEFAWSLSGGAGHVFGVMAYKGAAPRYTCQVVRLAPETPWSRARMRTLYLSTVGADLPAEDVTARTPPQPADEYGHFVRAAACDATGHFSFTGLPDGAWYVITVAVPVGGGTRIALMRRVEVNGDPVRVVLR